MATAKSPLSQSSPREIRNLPKAFILEQLERYYGAKPPERIVETDYSMWECADTGLQFAWPMLAGSPDFYEWISGFKSYYPAIRWEYGEVSRLLKTENLVSKESFRILDVGCGRGDFLRGLDKVPAERKYALDLNEPAVQECRRQGFQAFCGTVTMAMEAGFMKKAEFPVVTSFHCLEHVENPTDFVRSLAEVTTSGGRLFLSTPFSPMSFEANWFDILNHPPHHMTRWNLKAYERLAEIVGAKMRYFAPPTTALKRAIGVFRLLHYGPNKPIEKLKLATDLLRHLPEFITLYNQQLQRKRHNHGLAADVILIEFTIS